MAKSKPKFSPRHLIGIEHLSQDDICAILDLADKYAALGHQPKAQTPAFNRLIAANIFMEPSTRTRMSFEIAAERLGIKPLNFEAATSSLKKGESTLDTILTIDAMKPDVMIIRQGQRGLLDEISGAVSCPLVNAGDGTGEHPTQALLDALTIRQKKGTLRGKKVVIIGDIIHSRVIKNHPTLFILHGSFFKESLPIPKVRILLEDHIKCFSPLLIGDKTHKADIIFLNRLRFIRIYIQINCM